MSEPLCANCNWHQLDHVPDNGSACGSYTPITSFAEWAETEPDRPSPPVELKCERCGFSDDERIYCSQANCPRVDRPPAMTEPAESEGRVEIKKRRGRWGTTHFYIDGILELKGDYQRTGNAFDTEDQAREFLKTLSPTAPPAETEDAKALEDRAKHFWREETYAEELPHKRLARFTQAEIERQTPAILERFVEEVEKEVKSSDNYLIDQDPESGICIYDFAQAMQTVKARREGGEGK